MHGRTREGAHDRPDFVRRGERCWIDGDLIRLSSWPIGGIRPNGRRGPVPWLMDLAVLEEAMQEVYGGSFRLGDRAPLLQMAVNALAAGDRRRAADLASEVSFPPPEYASRLRNAGLRYLNWGPAHRRGNPTIDVEAWLERKAWERKYDPDQPRVPRGHPDGGQWTDDPSARDDGVSDLDRPVTDGEIEDAREVLAELDALLGRSAPVSGGLLHFVGGTSDPPKPTDPNRRYDLPPLTDEEVARHLPSLTPAPLAPAEGEPRTRGQLVRRMVERLRPVVALARRGSRWLAVASILVEYGFPEVVTYFDEPKTLAELQPHVRVEDYDSFEAFERKNPAGPGYQWHHIRERGFGSSQGWDVHATENIVRVPVIKHRRISDFYSSKPEALGGLTVREWLKRQDPAFQWQFGRYILQRRGVMQ